MDNNVAPTDQTDNQKAIRDLMEDLTRYGNSSGDEQTTYYDCIDLMADQAISGVDIRKRFPTFYNELLRHKKLRQLFIDTLAALISTAAKVIDPNKGSSEFDLTFLKRNINRITGWPVFLSQSQAQLMKVLFAEEPEFRTAVDPGAEPIYQLFRKDFQLADITYTVLINCTLAEDENDALNAGLSLTVENAGQKSAFPIDASLRWGEYSAEICLEQEGKLLLPNIPLVQVLDDTLSEVKSDLFLTLSSTVQ